MRNRKTELTMMLVPIRNLVKINLAQSRTRMKDYTHKRRSERDFGEGDWVYLRLKPYRQSSLEF